MKSRKAETADAAGETNPGKKDRRPFDPIRENVEAFLVAVILAIVIRHFAVEAFEIPTGSMANTLYGMHAWLECPNCSTDYNVALQSDSSTGEINVQYGPLLVYEGECPNEACTLALHGHTPEGRHLRTAGEMVGCRSCGTKFRGEPSAYRQTQAREEDARCPLCGHVVKDAVIEKSNRYGGHKILVTKFSYAIGKPRRWDVIVFEFDQWKNYIKRLVGLPGERIDVWDGDLYVNGEIERKSNAPHAQQSLWTKLSDSDVAERGLNKTPAWAEAPLSKYWQWNATLKRWSVNSLSPAGLRYGRGFDNYYSYNLLLPYGTGGYPDDIQVGDKKVAFTVRAAGRAAQARDGAAAESWIGAEIRDGGFAFQVRIPVGTASPDNPAVLARVEGDGEPGPKPDHSSGLRDTAPVAVAFGREARIEMENLDDRVAVRLDGTEILRLEYRSFPDGFSFLEGPRPPTPGAMKDAHHVHILASNLKAEVESIGVWRDMYYIPSRGGLRFLQWEGQVLGEGEYFAMGDNAPSSSDGRYWGSIPEKNLMGKAFIVFWPTHPLNFQGKFIR